MPRGQDIGFRRIRLGAVGFSNFGNQQTLFDTSITIRLRSSLFIIPDGVSAPPFPPTFTTKALYLSSLRWFATRSYQPIARGLPSSLMQLECLYVSGIHRDTLPPRELEQIAATSAKDEDMTAQWTARERALH